MNAPPPIRSLAKCYVYSDRYELVEKEGQLTFGLCRPNWFHITFVAVVCSLGYSLLILASIAARPGGDVHWCVYLLGFMIAFGPYVPPIVRRRQLPHQRPSLQMDQSTKTFKLGLNADIKSFDDLIHVCDCTWIQSDGCHCELQTLVRDEMKQEWRLLGQALGAASEEFPNVASEIADITKSTHASHVFDSTAR